MAVSVKGRLPQGWHIESKVGPYYWETTYKLFNDVGTLVDTKVVAESESTWYALWRMRRKAWTLYKNGIVMK